MARAFKELVIGAIRFQALDGNTFRFEVLNAGHFVSENTFFIPERRRYPGIDFTYEENQGMLTIFVADLIFSLAKNAKDLSSLEVKNNQGQSLYHYRDLANSGELPFPHQTPEIFAVSDRPRILLPERGYHVGMAEKTTIEERANDLYLLWARKDARLLHQLYRNLTGATELIPYSALGAWDSRYYEYTEKTVGEEIANYRKYGLPLDNFVIDTDWRISTSIAGTGYQVNTQDFPDIESLFTHLHEQHLHVMFNDHPEPLKNTHALDDQEIAYRHDNLQKLLLEGLDYWWYDRNWMITLQSPSSALSKETWGLYLYESVTRETEAIRARKGTYPRRPLVMGNVDNIQNGEYQGIRNSASHRYGIQWTGDVPSSETSLAIEFQNIIKGGNSGIAYINSDISGHVGNPDEELYCHWLAYGALSPIYRLHSTVSVTPRQPWLHGENGLKAGLLYSKLRYRLLPYFYSLARENYDTGMPLIRSLEFQGAEKENETLKEATIGDDLLTGVISEHEPPFIAPKSFFASPIKARYYLGKEPAGKVIAEKEYDDLNFDWSALSPDPRLPLVNYSATFEGDFENGGASEDLIIVSDDGIRVSLDGKPVFVNWVNQGANPQFILSLKPYEKHHFKIDYFQGEGQAVLKVALSHRLSPEEKNDFYFPSSGSWHDLFSGVSYLPASHARKSCPVLECPLFVKEGSIIPLAETMSNTSEKDFSTLSLALFPAPGKERVFTLYEDDGETTAYQEKEARFTKISFKGMNPDFVLDIPAVQGSFKGKRACENRQWKIRFHLIEGITIAKVLFDGENLPFTLMKKDPTQPPLANEGSARECNLLVCDFSSNVQEGHEVRFIEK